MEEKTEPERGRASSKDEILKHEGTILVFLYLIMLTSAQTRECSVVRKRYGDQIVFNNYTGTCDQDVNPCKQMNSEWGARVLKGLTINCVCQCSSRYSAYREDLKTCVKNEKIRDGCSLLFFGERTTHNLRVFTRSSSIKLYTRPRENCTVKGINYVTANSTVTWKQFPATKQQTFSISHQDRSKRGHAHYLKWKGKPAVELFGKIVKVNVQCRRSNGKGRYATRDLCIVFKIFGNISIPCLVSKQSSPTFMTTVSRTSTTELSNQTTTNPRIITDVHTVLVESSKTTAAPSVIDQGNRESHDAGKGSLPIWLIAVVAGGSVIATLCITAIIWICWKMKQRSRRKRKKTRSRLHVAVGNPLNTQDEDHKFITFAPPENGPAIDEAGYAKVGSPIRKGYAFLKPGPDRSRSEYQKLIKPNEDQSGYLMPLEEVQPTDDQSDAAIYIEPQSPKFPQYKPKSKDYDYAKPEGIIVLTASRTSLDNLDSKHPDTETNEARYVERRELELDPPSSPVYTTVERPNSPFSPEPSSEGPSHNNEDNDSSHPNDYVEVLPGTE